ncbi:CPBP family glutamic-type intramembrane protease [Fibrella aquatilis]|uniref:CPBP family intramembrane metalloprotease n=1 Tax=Fibrella aquatilis TaxID=2817059 RepID=A0A939G5T8_9BACT|nr:CPBP family glutamic-type intramembrane protease [Fibrella aquatilis]MBO0930318.1 CPBP family intramembrane metalloprotease [Fibrella aquatilis]
MNRLLPAATRAAFGAVNWSAVVCFYALACAISFALRNVPNPTESWLPYHTIFTFGLGPIGAALICRHFFPSVALTVSVLGTSPGRTLLFVGLPFWLGCLFGVANKRGIDPHLFGGLVMLSGVLYGIVEEAGWRGFLHNALRPLPTSWRVGITAPLWLGWHFTIMTDLKGVFEHGVFGSAPVWAIVLVFILGSWGLGNAAERTRSVLVAACLHDVMIIKLTAQPVAMSLLATGWAWMLWRWHQELLPTFWTKTKQVGLGVSLLLTGFSALAQPATPMPKQEINLQQGVPDFPLFDKAFYDNQLFLLGEVHGYQKPQQVDLALLKHLNQRVGVRYYIAEVDPTKAYYLNQYLQTGNDSTLRLVFRSWVANQAQWGNRDFYRKIQAIRAYNQTLRQAKRIRFVGIDAVQDRALVAQQLLELTANNGPARNLPLRDSIVAVLTAYPKRPDSLAAPFAEQWMANLVTYPPDYKVVGTENIAELQATLTGLVYRKTIKSREKTIFANFREAIGRLKLGNEKLYGFWGFYHVLQGVPKGSGKPFATLVNESALPMHGKVVSLVCRYVDSYSMLPTQYLPPFWQDKGKAFTRIDKFNDNGEMMKVSGIDSLIAQSRPNTTTLFKLTDTEAGRQPPHVTYSPFMPKEQQLNFNPASPTTDYFQYIVLIRNSDMTEPMEIKN